MLSNRLGGKPYIAELCLTMSNQDEKKMSVRYRDIKVPAPIYESAQILRQRTLESGLNQIPKEVTSPASCPLCGGSLEGFQISYKYLRCKECGFSQQQFGAKGSGGLGLGVIIGLGLAALAHFLSRSEPNHNSKRRSRRAR